MTANNDRYILTETKIFNAFNEKGERTGSVEKEVPVTGDRYYSVAAQKLDSLVKSFKDKGSNGHTPDVQPIHRELPPFHDALTR